jgi:hypothetical protein
MTLAFPVYNWLAPDQGAASARPGTGETILP